jgi:hypothetical protein
MFSDLFDGGGQCQSCQAQCGPVQSFIAQGEESRNLGRSVLDASGFRKDGSANIA